ncbi:MAG: hypothetical protein M5U14_17575 [Acidimicrobiia bacterium]|nr:hypothetical protein [Acidimicrobiia bacterium]
MRTPPSSTIPSATMSPVPKSSRRVSLRIRTGSSSRSMFSGSVSVSMRRVSAASTSESPTTTATTTRGWRIPRSTTALPVQRVAGGVTGSMRMLLVVGPAVVPAARSGGRTPIVSSPERIASRSLPGPRPAL